MSEIKSIESETPAAVAGAAPCSARLSKCPQCGESIVQTNLGNGQTDDYCEDCGWPDENRALEMCRPAKEWMDEIPQIAREVDKSRSILQINWAELPKWIERIQTDAIVSNSPNSVNKRKTVHGVVHRSLF